MKLRDYISCIKAMDVQGHTVTAKRSFWKPLLWEQLHEEGEKLLTEIAHPLDGNYLQISRGDIFEEKDLRKKIIKSLIWGYPAGNRGQDKIWIKKIAAIEEIIQNRLDNPIMDFEEDFRKNINGSKLFLGMSTYTKLLYFTKTSVCCDGTNIPALILDKRIEDVIASKSIEDLSDGEYNLFKGCKTLDYYNASKLYSAYLKKMTKASSDICVSSDQLEMFIFMFAGQIINGDPSPK